LRCDFAARVLGTAVVSMVAVGWGEEASAPFRQEFLTIPPVVDDEPNLKRPDLVAGRDGRLRRPRRTCTSGCVTVPVSHWEEYDFDEAR
jgi:hypothetical protein